LLSLRTEAKFLTVPYKGSAPAILDLVGSHVDVGFESVPGVMAYIQSHQLRAYAVASEERLENLPNVPTLKELGLKEFVAESWFAVLAPAGTPKEIVEKLSAALAKVAQMPIIKEQFAAQGMAPDWKSPEETRRFLKSEVERWAAIVKETGAKME
jgi:tripartite-type tricarboxylate transporter receptor subunit TctC